MNPEAMQKTVLSQRGYFNTGITRDVSFRLNALKTLQKAIKSREKEIMEALAKDLSKPGFESYAAEIGILYPEIREAIRETKSWSKPRRVSTSVLHFYSNSMVYREPYGVSLIIGPWNYPFQLTIAPLIAAISAGNCAVLKPSELSPNTSALIASMIAESFDPAYITVVEGGVKETQALLSEKFDYIFFTGGTAVGKIIMEAAAKHLTPVTLELGGKSPVILHKDARLDYSIKRIAWGKFFNAGQTCLATDYLLVHRDIKEVVMKKLRETIIAFYGEDPEKSPDYARIISERHVDRIVELMKGGSIYYGGRVNRKEKYIEPTIIDNVTLKDKIMKEEIFGPLLPVMEYSDINEAIEIINGMPRPLALYVFTESGQIEKRVLERTLSGGGCVNDTISHVGSTTLPFGGIGDSGIGSYHGKTGFDTFTHERSILKRSTLFDLSLRYPPYGKRLKLVEWLFRFIR